MPKHEHLLFYDGECGLCDHAVQFVLKYDHREKFIFAPLQGETAKQTLPSDLQLVNGSDTVVLAESWSSAPRLLIEGKAGLRVFWHLGGWFRLLGWMSFLPGWPFNLVYRLIARNRHRLFGDEQCFNPNAFPGRFLD